MPTSPKPPQGATDPTDREALQAAIGTLEGLRAQIGDAVVDLALAPLRARLASLQRPTGLRHHQVTVLFADVVGSTAMADGLPAEDTLAILNATMQRMADIVEARQGRVLRFTGDGIKAAFGMDEVREDDAERAVRAGLAICQAGREQAEAVQRRHGLSGFALRVGVHTGDVALGAGIDADDTAMGAAVNVAARMEQNAPPGALRISHDTWSQVRGLFEVEPQAPLQVKGIAAPINTYLVRAALDRGVASVERGLQGLSTPLVGRQAELQRLLDAIESVRRTRTLQATTLLGEAGLGKSRLLREFKARLSAGAGGCVLLTVRAQPDGQLRAWGLLRSLLAASCGLTDTDSAEAARRKVIEGLSPWFSERGERQARLIGHLAGLDFSDSADVRGLDPRGLSDQALAALRGYLRARAADGGTTLVLLVEDLHWADDSSLDLLQHLIAHAAELPLVLVMTARPALRTRRPGWGPAESVVSLQPLAAPQGDELARALLARLDAVPQRLTELLTTQAEGNPYYMEELVRRLIDDGVIAVDGLRWTVAADRLDTLRLPGTLVGLLQARLDALPLHERVAARQASIIGHVFWDDALQTLDARAPQALPALQHAAFVRAHETSDFEGTTERQFDHHLLHQVTYDTLLRAERMQGHAAAARWLAERTKGRGAEFLAMTGEHAERAGDIALAVDCFERAGAEASHRFANTLALGWLRRALLLLGDAEPVRRMDLLAGVQRVADTVGDRSAQEQAGHEIAAILAHHPDDQHQARLDAAMSLLADRRGDAGTSELLAGQAFEGASRCGDARTAAMAQGQLAWLHIARHDYAGGRRHLEASLVWAARIEQERVRAETEAQLLTLSGMVSMQTSQLHDARVALLAVLARGEALEKPRLQMGALDNLSAVEGNLGLWAASARWGERLMTLATAVGSPGNVASGQFRLGVAAEALGDLSTALSWQEQQTSLERSVGNRRMEAIGLRHLASLHLQMGDPATALRFCELARALHAALSEPLEAWLLTALSALCALRLAQPEVALAGVNTTLAQLAGELAHCPAAETLEPRWWCHQVLAALADARATPLLGQLQADVRAHVGEVTDAADGERLIQARPILRAIMAASAAPGDSTSS